MSNLQKVSAVCALLLVALPEQGRANETLKPLEGAWASQGLVCDQVFRTEGGRTRIKSLDGFNSGVFIIDGDRITGQSVACKISRATRRGSTISLLLACETGIMSSAQELYLELHPNGTVTRRLAGFTDFAEEYKPCR